MDNKTLIPGAIIIAGLLIAGAVFYNGGGGGNGSDDPVAEQEDALRAAALNLNQPAEDDHLRGSTEAELVLVEFSDFQCPFCSRFHGTVQEALDEYDGDFAWMYRHLPLTSIHPQALPAAVASECAASLGGNDAFWSFADALFENQDSLSTDFYNTQAAALGINADDFAACQQDEAVVAAVQEDFENAQASGGSGTPFSILVSRNDISDEAAEAITTLGEGLRQPGRTAPILVADNNRMIVIGGAQDIAVLRIIIDAILGTTEEA